MAEQPVFIEQRFIVKLYNGLADELNTEKEHLRRHKGDRDEEDYGSDPLFNYVQGKVIGLGIGVNALRAFLEAQSADSRGLLTAEAAGKIPNSTE
ncbi:hypothetical protein H0V99_00035 [Candidatus Saccharibacteria bacterium]|nr:hypothetical protein [Candidatus Saccharibacteria bacterium]